MFGEPTYLLPWLSTYPSPILREEPKNGGAGRGSPCARYTAPSSFPLRTLFSFIIQEYRQVRRRRFDLSSQDMNVIAVNAYLFAKQAFN